MVVFAGMFDEFTPSEIGSVTLGVIGGATGHMLFESLFDDFYQGRGIENYDVWSTLTTAAIFTVLGIGAYLYGRNPGVRWLQYVAGGIFFVEIVQILDLIRVRFFLKE